MAVIPGVLLPHNPQQRMRIRMGVHLLIVDVATLVEDKDGGTLVDRPDRANENSREICLEFIGLTFCPNRCPGL